MIACIILAFKEKTRFVSLLIVEQNQYICSEKLVENTIFVNRILLLFLSVSLCYPNIHNSVLLHLSYGRKGIAALQHYYITTWK